MVVREEERGKGGGFEVAGNKRCNNQARKRLGGREDMR